MGERFPVVSWFLDRPDPLDIAQWQLKVSGAVTQPLSLSYAALLALPQQEQVATLDCTGGWYTVQAWRGVALGELLKLSAPLEEAESITVRSSTGYQRRFTLDEAAGYLLALELGAATLVHGHGFPMRLVAPDKRGVEWVKWVSEIRVNRTAKIWQSPLPLQ
jgi:DMSO/TMAO reductase YedYZ molybdopterin-dependent catalytic subunit